MLPRVVPRWIGASVRFVTAPRIRDAKGSGTPLVMVTAYDAPSARTVDTAGADLILVGDSVAMVVLGYDDTLQVTTADMVHHVAAVTGRRSLLYVSTRLDPDCVETRRRLVIIQLQTNQFGAIRETIAALRRLGIEDWALAAEGCLSLKQSDVGFASVRDACRPSSKTSPDWSPSTKPSPAGNQKPRQSLNGKTSPPPPAATSASS
jgi:hypothetical protein